MSITSSKYKGHTGYKKVILQLLDSDPNQWHKSYELRCRDTGFGWIGSRGDRDARFLAQHGEIEVSHDRSGYAEYRSKELPPPKPVPSAYRREVVSSMDPSNLTLKL